MTNRSAPPSSVIPVLLYPDIFAAAAWLKKAFGFRERLRIADHRIQMHAFHGHLVLHKADVPASHSSHLMIRTDNIDELFKDAIAAGATAIMPPRTFEYGERQCSVEDPFGYHWHFTQTVADIDPATWGGEVIELD